MSKKHQFEKDKDENGEKLDPFYEMLQVLDVENLIRFRKRLERVGRKRMVAILTEEIEERDNREKAQAKTAETEAFAKGKAEKALKR